MFEFMCAGSRVPLSEVKRHVHGKLYDELDITVKPRASDCDAMLQCGDRTMIAEFDNVRNESADSAVPSAEFPLMLTRRITTEIRNSSCRQTLKRSGTKTDKQVTDRSDGRGRTKN